MDIEQEEYIFNFEMFNNSMTLLINTKEQIFVEKLLSMLKHGIGTTRYKDIYDFYYLITEGNMDKSLLIKLINIYCFNSDLRINTTYDIANELSKIFKNANFLENVQNSRYNWIEEETVICFLENNIEKLEQQPKSIVHGDLNQDNIIIEENGNVGIIDFGNSDIDYSYQDAHQIQMYNRFLSKGLSAGVIDGYLQGKDNQKFWESYKIYSAYYCLSKIIWAYRFRDTVLIKDMLRRAKQTVEDFDYFRSDKPIWYEEYKRKKVEKREDEER